MNEQGRKSTDSFDPIESTLNVIRKASGDDPAVVDRYRDRLENNPIGGGDVARFIATQIEMNIAILKVIQAVDSDSPKRFDLLDRALDLASRANIIGTDAMANFVTKAVEGAPMVSTQGNPEDRT